MVVNSPKKTTLVQVKKSQVLEPPYNWTWSSRQTISDMQRRKEWRVNLTYVDYVHKRPRLLCIEHEIADWTMLWKATHNCGKYACILYHHRTGLEVLKVVHSDFLQHLLDLMYSITLWAQRHIRLSAWSAKQNIQLATKENKHKLFFRPPRPNAD
jgi:hypothetical protein